MGKRGARAFKDNFWSRKRIESGFKVHEVAELLHLSDGIVGMYFTGQRVPTEDTIKKICTFFGVDIVEGTREFANAAKVWDAEVKGREAKLHSNTGVHSNAGVGVVSEEVVPITPVVVEPAQSVPESLLKALYKKVPYEDFKAILDGNMSESEVLALAYDKVDFDTFMTLVNN